MPIFDTGTRIAKFATVGIASNSLCYLAFLMLLFEGLSAVAANALCYLIGFTIGYLANYRWTFRSTNRHQTDLIRFGGAHLAGFISSVGSMAMLVRLMPAPVAQLAAIVIAAVIIFVVLQMLRFGQPPVPRRST